MAHNRYQTPGGEDRSTHDEADLLRTAGHRVDLWEVSNDTISGGGIGTAFGAIWSTAAVAELRKRLVGQSYDLLHVQNYFPLLSPAILFEASRQGVATVQHLRNYRHLCVNAGFFRDGRPCRDCAKASWPWRGIVHKCYRDSHAASAVPAISVAVHRLIGTYGRRVDAFIAISDCVRDAHIAGGFPSDRVHRRYSAVLPGLTVPFDQRRRELLCASRLTGEKGIDHLIRTWRRRPRSATLAIAGSGPMEAELRHLAGDDSSIVFLGQLSPEAVKDRMANAMAVINCSLWPEPFGRTPVEAFASGVAAIVSDAGGLAESVVDGVSGLIVPPGDDDRLDAALTRLLNEDGLAEALGNGASMEYARKFHPRIIAAESEQIYRRALQRRRGQLSEQKVAQT